MDKKDMRGTRREFLGAVVGGVIGYGFGLLAGSLKPNVVVTKTETQTTTVTTTTTAQAPATPALLQTKVAYSNARFIKFGEPGRKRIVVIGGGPAGVSFINQLLQIVPKEKVSILLIDKNVYWVSGPAQTEIAEGEMGYEGVVGVINSLSSPPTVDVLNSQVGWIDPDNRLVYTELGAVEYDYLLIATGMVFADWEIPGLAYSPNLSIYAVTTYSRALTYYYATERLKSGTIIIGIPQAPYKCGPAPFETAFMTYERLRKRGVENFKIIILDANPRPAPGPDTRRKIILDFINNTNGAIEYHPGEYVKAVDPATKTLESTKGEKYKWDVLMIIGPARAPDWLIASGLAKRFVTVDRRTFRHIKYNDIYSAGDAQGFTNLGYAVGSGAVVAESIARDMGYEPQLPTKTISNENYNNLYDNYFIHIKLVFNVDTGKEQAVAELVHGSMYKNIRLGWIRGSTSLYPIRF